MLRSWQHFFRETSAMMRRESDFQHKLFITGFNLDTRIRKDHILRKISEKIDFNFIYKELRIPMG
jgi:hypothetical protein